MSKRKQFLDRWARRGKPPSGLPDVIAETAPPSKGGARVFIGTIESMDDCGVLADKTGQQRFMIVADVLAEFIGQRVQIAITPLAEDEATGEVREQRERRPHSRLD